MKVAETHFEIREQQQAAGVITAERTMTAWGYGAWVGIFFITPTQPRADAYRVEVVSRRKLTIVTNITEQGWEGKILRDIQDVVAGRPIQ